MQRHLNRAALIIGLTGGLACGIQNNAPFAESCEQVEYDFYSCQNLSQDEGDTYFADCVARGKKVHSARRVCGQLWTEAYACVAALDCEDFELWRTMRSDPTLDFPCAAEGLAFLTQCPNLPLYSDG